MSVKSDRWILTMCREHQLITPFAEKLVREIEGRRIISAGLSSYGYDLRLAPDGFRVFSPIASAEIDPKHFDEGSLINAPLRTSEDGSQYWLMPPHTYALGVTVETFNIPRNVIALCIGKSTYARCFRGDTRVALVDGTTPTLEEMAGRAEKGEIFWGYSLGDYGRIIVTLLEAPRCLGRDTLLKLTLDNREEIFCTSDHEFLKRDGQLAQAVRLRPGDSLMPLYRKLVRGYESVYQPLNGHLISTHRLADEWNIRNGIYADTPGTHRHHKDGDRLNNLPLNIERMNASDHIRYHNTQNYQHDFDPVQHGAAIREALERLRQDDDWYRNFTRSQRNKALNFWHSEVYEEARQRLICDRTVFRRFPHIIHQFKGTTGASLKANHKVTAIEEVSGQHDVYCLTVPEAGNFALAAGVFVKNCGIIVNTTPLEPSWRGRLVLEFSNSADLPVRIYANEGIAQVTFFESDEDCDVSYADRQGKYQNQEGLVTARL